MPSFIRRRRPQRPGIGRALALVATAGLLVAPDCNRSNDLPRVAPGFREVPMVFLNLRDVTDQDVVDAVAAFPDELFRFQTTNLRPIGHPDTSAADCVANPESIGCRFASIRALAALQGVAADHLCMTSRFDVYRKSPSYPVDEIDGVSFDPSWVIHVPGDRFEADAAAFRNGLVYRSDLDGAWVEGLEDACCHDAVPDNCTAQDQCAFRYGSGDDVSQRFVVADVGVDVSSPSYRQWGAGRILAKLDDVGADCFHLGIKTGRFQYYDGADSGDRCFVPGSGQYFGPVQPFDPCAAAGQPLSANPYGPGEFEEAWNGMMKLLLSRLHLEGRGDVDVVTVEKPGNLPELWAWMEDDVSSIASLAGDLGSTIYPFGPPPDTTRALLYPPPFGGLAPVLDVDLVVEIAGRTDGPSDVHVWCDCGPNTEDVAEAQERCGTAAGEYYEVLGTLDEIVSMADACDYPDVGTYYPKALVIRGGDTGQDRIAVNVDP